METGNEILVAVSKKRRQGSRFLGRRLVQSSTISAGRLSWSDRRCRFRVFPSPV
jgi:hypothetical protein